jgi:hypothetical protein
VRPVPIGAKTIVAFASAVGVACGETPILFEVAITDEGSGASILIEGSPPEVVTDTIPAAPNALYVYRATFIGPSALGASAPIRVEAYLSEQRTGTLDINPGRCLGIDTSPVKAGALLWELQQAFVRPDGTVVNYGHITCQWENFYNSGVP